MTAPATSLVQAALARPIPKGLHAAVEAARFAHVAHSKARGALEDLRRKPTEANAASARDALSAATARRDVAKLIGDDVDALDVEIRELRERLDHAETAHASRAAMDKALRDEIEWRRDVLSAANDALNKAYATWSAEVLAAADDQLAQAANLAGEAQRAAAALRPHLDAPRPVSLIRIGRAGYPHEGPKYVDLPPDIEAAVNAWYRGFSATLHS